MRTFLAIPIHFDDVHLDIDKIPKYFRKVNKMKWHITLKFFGSKNKYEIREIIKKISKYKLEGLRLFNPRLEFFSNRVFAVRYDYKGGLIDQIKDALDIDKFTPHLTIARVKGSLDKKDKERLLKGKVESEIDVGEIVLYKSVLTPKGPEYEELFKWMLSE